MSQEGLQGCRDICWGPADWMRNGAGPGGFDKLAAAVCVTALVLESQQCGNIVLIADTGPVLLTASHSN